MKRIPSRLLFALIPALFMTATDVVTAQLPATPDLVYVRLTATESAGRPITGLRKEQFKVFEDGMPQDIVYFSDEDLPLRVGVLLNAGGATKDEVKAKVLSGLTKSADVHDEFFFVESGNAPLNDAVLQTLNTLAQGGNNRKRALVLFTSKGDPRAYSFSKVRDRLKEQDIQLYVTALEAGSDTSKDSVRQMLRELAELSGGNSFFPSATFQLEDIYLKIGVELKNQYRIGYRSTNRATDGKWRKIKVIGEYQDNVTRNAIKVNVRTKPGYYPPTAALVEPAPH